MEVLGQVIGLANTIYSLCEQSSSNKRQCRRLKKRVKMLLMTIQALEKQNKMSTSLHSLVMELAVTLENAKCWVIKYSHHAWWRKILQANSIKEEFAVINDRLGDAAGQLCLFLAAEHREKLLHFFTENTRKFQNEKDIEEDLKELRDYLTSCVSSLSEKVDTVADDVHDILSELAAIRAVCKRSRWDITEIRATDLQRGALLLEKPSHNLYRGEYHRSPVAIKVFKGQPHTNEDYIRKTFQAESETMKKFECLNIVRLYGICIDNSGKEPCYSMVTEFCEKGNLRELLKIEPDLSWERRVLMALDAARALYRLHQTEMKAILHGSLSSSKFLVDGTYCVKLSGFEISKTESSIRKPSNAEKRKESIELAYIAPETLQDINAYDKRSEIYSLGVVIYEIATGKLPFQDLPVTENTLLDMQQDLCAEVAAELSPACVPVLRDLIIRSLQKNPSDRPSAGVIVDQLMAHLNQRDC
ncbi:mixed lineage kinase domain-like protein [Pseudophryne corroboree]|uniref:mixed lineage kinase domain-like protein n=1 Tax=Pseudophryne corroboree TaxID=495146 RepID=UPI003081DCDB